MKLDEDATRAKMIELLDRMDENRMNLWLWSGIMAHALDAELTERVMFEEIPKRSHEVQMFWAHECNCDGHLN